MRRQMRIGAKRQTRRPEPEVEPCVLQFGADDGERFDAERLQLFRRRRHLRERAPAERTVQARKQTEQQRGPASIVSQRDRSDLPAPPARRSRAPALPGLTGICITCVIAFCSKCRLFQTSAQERKRRSGIRIETRSVAELPGLFHVLLRRRTLSPRSR